MSEQQVFVRSTIALFVAFFPLAFSDDLLNFSYDFGLLPATGPEVLVADAVIYVLLALLIFPIGTSAPRSRSRRLFVESFVATMILDSLSSCGLLGLGVMGEVLSALLYLVPQVLIYLSIALAPRAALRSGSIWTVGGPLLLGTGLTWLLGAVVWPDLLNDVKQNGQPFVSAEYFAQMTQLLPVLLIALAAELRFFRDTAAAPSGARKARTAVVAGLITVGTFAAALALLRPTGDDRPLLSDAELWGQYVAYVVTVNALTVSLVALAWALIVDSSASSSHPPTPDRAPEEGRAEAAARDRRSSSTSP